MSLNDMTSRKIIPLEKTDLKHLFVPGVCEHALEIRDNEIASLTTELIRLLRSLAAPDQTWSFSFLGPLSRGKNLSVIEFATSPPFRFAYAVGKSLKRERDEPPKYIEVSLLCDLEDFESLLNDSRIELGFDLYIGGWQLPSDTIATVLDHSRFREGKFVWSPKLSNCAFYSNFDFDTIYFLHTNWSKLLGLSGTE